MAPNEIIEKLVNLAEHVEDLLRFKTTLGTVACESLRMRLIQLPQNVVDGRLLSYAASVREQLASFLPPQGVAPASIVATPGTKARSSAPTTYAQSYDAMRDGWMKVKEEFGVTACKGLMQRLLHVARLCDIPASDFDVSIELTHTIMQMKHDYVHYVATDIGLGLLDPRTWLAHVKQPSEWAMATHQVLTQPATAPATAPAAAPVVSPLEVKLARQIEGKYYHDRRDTTVPQCWFCSATMPADRADTFSTLAEQHNEGCAVPLARQIIENYNANQEQL